MPAVAAKHGFKKAAIEPAQLAKSFAQVPELLRIGHDLRYFTEGDVKAEAAHRRRARRAHVPDVAGAVEPETGAELLVAAARGKTMSFVVALWTFPGER